MNYLFFHGSETLYRLMAQKQTNELLYKIIVKPGYTVRLRTLEPVRDLKIISEWMERPDARRFWDEDNSLEHLVAVHNSMRKNKYACALMAELNDNSICLIEIYRVVDDELSAHIPVSGYDFGIHFMMAPAKERIANLSVFIMQQCLRFLFSFSDVHNIYGEPDAENSKANLLVQKAGFSFLKAAALSYKTANIYCCSRTLFNQANQYQPEFLYA